VRSKVDFSGSAVAPAFVIFIMRIFIAVRFSPSLTIT
jgi:hypothetical protein